MADKGLTLVQKLLELRKSVTYLQKADKGAQYKYTGSSAVLGAVRGTMNDLGLIIIPKVVSTNIIDKENAKGSSVYFTEIHMTYDIVDTATGETLTIPWYAQGVDIAGEKGVGKAYTYGEKYLFLKLLNIPTDQDDPDAFQDKLQKQLESEPTIKEEKATKAKAKAELLEEMKGLVAETGVDPKGILLKYDVKKSNQLNEAQIQMEIEILKQVIETDDDVPFN